MSRNQNPERRNGELGAKVDAVTGIIESLAQHHRNQLESSAIDPEIIAERGYRTATTKSDLERLGFGRAQRNVPAMVIPIYNVHGELALRQIRPDEPRIKDGKVVKYETQSKASLALDVPRRIRDQLGDPSVPLWITEGSKKVDSALSHGLACIGVVGVYGWRGTNDVGGKTVLPDLEYIAWNDRKVYMAFDSDAMEKPEVHQALKRLADVLKHKGAKVRYINIPSPDGRKVGLDDFLADGGTVDDLLKTASSELPSLPSDEPDATPEWKPTNAALEAGRRLLDEPDLLGQAAATVAALGLAGDLKNAKILYLALTSRLLERPMNLVVSGPSSAGKSHLVNTVARLFPLSATYPLTAMSERALVYTEADLRHRHLLIGESTALNRGGIGTTILRNIAWEGRLSYETVEKTSQGMRARRIEKPGPTGFVSTTTRRIDSELDTRVLTVHVADTADATQVIVAATAERLNGHVPAGPDLEPWHALQWSLAHEGDRAVTIPFAPQLGALVPVDQVRMRRDFVQLANLIQSSAILHQHQRDRDEHGRIIAAREDYELIYELTAEMFGAIQAEGVTGAIRDTVLAVSLLTGSQPHSSIPQVASYLDLSKGATDKRVRRACDGGWLINDEERPRRPAKLKLGDPLPDERPALPDPDVLFNTHPTPPLYLEGRQGDSLDFPHVDGKNSQTLPMSDSRVTGVTDGAIVRQSDNSQTLPMSDSFPDVDGPNGDSHPVTHEDIQGGCGVHPKICWNRGAFRTCADCGGNDWWILEEQKDDPLAPYYCGVCDPPVVESEGESADVPWNMSPAYEDSRLL